MTNSPYFLKSSSVQSIMVRVLLAMVPGIAMYVWCFGVAILIQLAVATTTALVAEAALLALRGKPIRLFLTDGSAVVTAWLVALSFPSIAPWWLTVLGTLAAIGIAKHLYGGLGQNPFNPAMVGYALMVVAYPLLMSQWPTGDIGFNHQWQAIFGSRQLDALTMATPLDSLRTALHGASTVTVASVTQSAEHAAVFGNLGGRGWEWIATGYMLGGLWLIQQRIISWHLPIAFLAAVVACSGVSHLLDSARFAGPMFHLFSGGTLLAAFFIVTDPVSGSTTPRGKLVFAAGVGLLTWIIRSFGAYPDGIAFAVLLMNIAVPLIDHYTQPPVFGHKRRL